MSERTPILTGIGAWDRVCAFAAPTPRIMARGAARRTDLFIGMLDSAAALSGAALSGFEILSLRINSQTARRSESERARYRRGSAAERICAPQQPDRSFLCRDRSRVGVIGRFAGGDAEIA